MTKIVFALEDGRAIPVQEAALGCNEARFLLCDGRTGTLVIGEERFSLGAEGAAVSASALKGGIHTPAFFVEGRRYEAPPLLTFGGTLLFLPPRHTELYALQGALRAAEERLEALGRRIDALTAHLECNHIF